MSLRTEITDDPLALGYAGMTDQQVLDSLHGLTRSRNRAHMTASTVLNQVDVVEFNALTNVQQRRIWDVLHIGDINPFGVEATIFQGVFGASTTITNLQAARVEAISRVQELDLGRVKLGHIEEARR